MTSRTERPRLGADDDNAPVSESSLKPRQRIQRACDRCKVKKSKCDGGFPCENCKINESICQYSARRRREARDWYWNMHDIIDEAFQRLYWACRHHSDFPGVLPDESQGHVTTEAILQGLGLIGQEGYQQLRRGSSEKSSGSGQPTRGRILNPPDMNAEATQTAPRTDPQMQWPPLTHGNFARPHFPFGASDSSSSRSYGSRLAPTPNDSSSSRSHSSAAPLHQRRNAPKSTNLIQNQQMADFNEQVGADTFMMDMSMDLPPGSFGANLPGMDMSSGAGLQAQAPAATPRSTAMGWPGAMSQTERDLNQPEPFPWPGNLSAIYSMQPPPPPDER